MKKLIFSILFCLIFALSAFFCQNVPNVSYELSFATEEQLDSPLEENENEMSIFIRNPSHSVFYEDKLYFIDETDNLLKIYDKETDSFLSDFIDLSSYNIIDATFLNGFFYLMTESNEENQIIKINLSSLELSELEITVANTNDYSYNTFFAQKVSFDEKDYTLLSISGFRLSPVIALIDNETDEVLNVFDISFRDTIVSSVDFIKVLSYQQEDGTAFIIFVYDTTIAYYEVSTLDSITDLEDNPIGALSSTPIPIEMARALSDENITDVGFMNISSNDYLAIFFSQKDLAGDFIRLYNFDFDDGIDPITYSAEFACDNTEFVGICGDYFSVPNKDKQEIYFNNIVKVELEDTLLLYSDFVDNPNYTINYLDFTSETDNDEIYMKSNKQTEMFSDPWGAKSDIIIDAQTDVLKIGNVVLENDIEIKDYMFCMYSFAGKNHIGFIKTSDLELKDEILLEDAGYKPRVKVWPNTRLYTLPTNVTGGISTSLRSKVLMEIEDNYEVEVLDIITGYVANGTKMIKVKVNGLHIGYIEEKCISNPSEVIKFVITNATIQKDNTVVYHEANKDSTALTFTLSAGKNVRINGKRNTDTGWTSITFNDEYGNEFTGYIETDFVKADAWSTMQIIGCVLIAVNFGLLILILMYKKNHLGNNGHKIEDETEENLK